MAIYRGLDRLIVVDVTLDRGTDDPQLIFESLNSTGIDLSQSDLIRNYILMRLPEKQQTELYDSYWSKLESLFRGSEKTFDAFLRDYLAFKIKASKQEKADEIYQAFRRNFNTLQESCGGLETLLAEMLRLGRYYAAFSIGSPLVADLSDDLARLRRLVDVPALLIMRLFDCHDRCKTLTVIQFREAIHVMEIEQAKQAELRELAERRDVAKVPMSAAARELFVLLQPRIHEIDPALLELAESKSVSYHAPGFFLEVLPRKHKLLLLLPLDHSEIEDPHGLSEDATEWKFLFYAKHEGGVLLRIKQERDIEHALPIIRQAHAMASVTSDGISINKIDIGDIRNEAD